MVSWSLETLLLALYVIAIICAAYIVFKTMRQSTTWGTFMLLTFGAFMLLRPFVFPLIAGILVIAAQAYYIRRRYVWETLGRFYVYAALCWAGSTYIDARRFGWVPASWRSAADREVQQTGASLSAEPGVESFLPVRGGRIWYRRTGSGTGTPVILLHGGPGVGSFYLKPLERLGDERPVIRYDQLGAGHSAVSRDTAHFTIAHYVSELDSLRAALGYDRVHILGHSWGSILGFEYYRAHPQRVASLTLASAALNSALWTKNTLALLETLPDTMQKIIVVREAAGDFDAPDYLDALNEYAGRYVWLRPIEKDLDSAVKTMNWGIYAYMRGANALTVTGTLKTYNATTRLRRVKVPTMYTVGEFDQAGPETIRGFAKLTPGAKMEVIPDAAHVTTWDNPAEMLRVVRQFLRDVDSTTKAAIPSISDAR